MKIWHNKKLYQHVDNVVAAATVSEAYLIKQHLFDSKGGDGYKFINTGTIDPYLPLWGICRTQYIKSSYQHPRIAARALKRISAMREKQANSTKIIIAGMSNRLEAIFDEGEYLAGKSTSIILGNSQVLKALVAIVNSRVLSFFLNHFFHSLKMAGGYINVGPEIIKNLPICPGFACDRIISFVEKMITAFKRNPRADTAEIERQLDLAVFKLYKLNWDEVRIVDPEFPMSKAEYAAIVS